MISKKRYTSQPEFSDFKHQSFNTEKIKALKGKRQPTILYKCTLVNGYEQNFGATSKEDAIKKVKTINSIHNPSLLIWTRKGYRIATLYKWSDSKLYKKKCPWIKVKDILIPIGQ